MDQGSDGPKGRGPAVGRHGGGAPSSWVTRFAPLIAPGGEVLDLACGGGRHARYLAARGHPVLAVDRDEAALASLAAVAGVAVLAADLEGAPWPLAGRRFAAVVVTSYLHRPLLPPIALSLDEGGLLIYETFLRGQERLGRPSNPAFLLAPGELLAAFPSLAVVAFEQGRVLEGGVARAVQRLCAVRLAPGVGIDQIELPPA